MAKIKKIKHNKSWGVVHFLQLLLLNATTIPSLLRSTTSDIDNLNFASRSELVSAFWCTCAPPFYFIKRNYLFSGPLTYKGVNSFILLSFFFKSPLCVSLSKQPLGVSQYLPGIIFDFSSRVNR